MSSKIFLKIPSYLIVAVLMLLITGRDSEAQYKETISSVQQAISLALKNNSNVITAYLDKVKAQEKVSEVYSENLVPTLTLNSRYIRNFKSQIFYIAGEQFAIGTDNTFTNQIDLVEPIPILGTPVFSGIRIAEYYEKNQAENILNVENTVRADVKKAYYTVLLTKAVVDVNQLTLENAQENFDVVNSKYVNGVATEFDYLRARVRVENSIPELDQSNRNYEISRKALINAIGLKSTEDIQVVDELTYDSTEVWANEDYLISKISEDYVQVRQLRIAKDINEELVKVDKANYLPKLNVFGQYVLGTGENDGQSISNYRFYNTLNAGIGLYWDLNLFRNSHKVKQSEIEVKKTQEQINDVKQKLKLLSQSAIIAIEDAKQRIQSQRSTLSLAERSLELANASYRAGALNQIDVQAAELSLSQTRLSYLQAIYDYQIAKAELEKLLEK